MNDKEIEKLARDFSEKMKEFGESHGRGFIAGYRAAKPDAGEIGRLLEDIIDLVRRPGEITHDELLAACTDAERLATAALAKYREGK